MADQIVPRHPQFPNANPLVKPHYAVESTNPFQNLGFGLLLLYLYLSFSRLLDVAPSSFRLPMVSFVLMVMCLVASGETFKMVSSHLGWLMVAFTIWVMCTVPFSLWRAESIKALTSATMSLVLFVAIVAFVSNMRRARRVMITLALASLTGALLSVIFASDADRQALSQGTFADANEYSMTLLMGLPCWWMIAKNAGMNLFKKALAYICMVPVFISILKAGSRGGFLALICIFAILFLGANLPRKILLAGTAVVFVLAATFLLPASIKARYLTFFTVTTSVEIDPVTREKLASTTVSSTQGRLSVLGQSLVITLQHPLFGVGPGCFPIAQWENLKKHGINAWTVTHNSYTQVSSETGLPGFIFFISMVVGSFRTFGRMLRAGRTAAAPAPVIRDIVNTASYLRLSFAVIAVCGFFLSFAYGGIFQILIGITVALDFAVQKELAQFKMAEPEPVQARIHYRGGDCNVPGRFR